MARSQLPCPLFLLCSLLLLPSVLLVSMDPTDNRLKVPATFAMQQFNEVNQNPNYFKDLGILKADVQPIGDTIIYLMMQVGETVCEKSNQPMPYSEIQKCELPPLDQQKTLVCNFQLLKVRDTLELTYWRCF